MMMWISGKLIKYYHKVLKHVIKFWYRKGQYVRIACVGDSITAGTGLANKWQDSYPAVLQRLLGRKYWVENLGVGGRTLINQGEKAYQKHKVYGQAMRFQPHLVIIALGTNDLHDQVWAYRSQFVADYVDLIVAFRALPTQPDIYVCYPPPIFHMDQAEKQQRLSQTLLPLISKVAKEEGVATVNWFRALTGRPLAFSDGIHPNEIGTRIMAETAAKALASPNGNKHTYVY